MQRHAPRFRVPLFLASVWLAAASAGAQVRPDAVLIRFPDVSREHICFRYDGDIWLVAKQGGEARRLSSPPGNESFARFSPDGQRIAVMASYEGGSDLYVLSLDGGLPERVTYHPGPEYLCDWHPNGQDLLFWSSRESGIARAPQIFAISARGGAAQPLPIPYGTFGALDDAGRRLAYTPISREFRTWKRYQGGMAQDIWVYDLESHAAQRITDHPGTDALPMWHGERIVFLSDRGPHARMNLWEYDPASAETRALTDFADWDVTFPSIGPEDVVFENGGRLWRYEFATRQCAPVDVIIPGDRRALRTVTLDVAELVQHADVGPSGKRAVFEARGELFSVPAEEGFVRNLTDSSGVAERTPAWSPDGLWIAYFSDRAGEYDLWLRRSDGRAFRFGPDGEELAERRVAELGVGWKTWLGWSPDSKRIAFSNNFGALSIVELATGAITPVDTEHFGNALEASWSGDSGWLAYATSLDGTTTTGIQLYELATGARTRVTSPLASNSNPVFDPAGDWLYYTSNRTFEPIYSDFDDTWVYANATNLCAVPLRADVENPWAVENPEETDEPEADEEEADEQKAAGDDADGGEDGAQAEDGAEPDGAREDANGKASEGAGEEAASEEQDEKAEKAEKPPEPVVIELAGFEERAILLPIPAGNFGDVAAVAGKLVYVRRPRAGAGGDAKSKLCIYELGEDEEQVVLEEAEGFALAAGGERALVSAGEKFAVVKLEPGQKLDEPLDLSGLRAAVEPRAEWEQIVRDAHRLMRDYFYDASMHGVDWQGVRDRYLGALASATSRDDVHYLLGQMIAELNVGHAYSNGPPKGLQEAEQGLEAGLLGCDWLLRDGAWQIERIIGGEAYDYDARGPLEQLGVDVREGDFVLAVNGAPVDPSREVHAALLGTAGKPTELVVNAAPELDGNERRVLVEPVADEGALRYRDWVASKRAYVAAASGGRIGYVHVPDTGVNGQSELVRQFTGQYQCEALIIDERWNSGGQIPTRFVELLERPPTNYWATRTAELTWPIGGHGGPKAMLINGSSGSGGDAFPYYFRQAGLGPLIGTRTWGGLVGISGGPAFVDGASISVPSFSFFELDNTWGVEGRGVEPDIEVVDDPSQMQGGRDPQLERAIEHLAGQLAGEPKWRRQRPLGPVRTGAGIPVEDF